MEEEIKSNNIVEGLHYDDANEAHNNLGGTEISVARSVLPDNFSYTKYIIQSPLFSGDLERRYSDFFSLREKLLRNYPGVYIPSIPPKVYINNKSVQTISQRQRVLNNFCLEISRIPILMESQEFHEFFSPWQIKDSVGAKIKALPDLGYDMILLNYRKYFNVQALEHNDYNDDDNNNNIEENEKKILTIVDLARYLKQINDLLKIITKSKEKISEIVENELNQIKIESRIFHYMTEYEKKILIENINKDTNKLVFYNMNNAALSTKAINYTKEMTSPNKILLEFLEDKELDLFSMREMINGYVDLLHKKNTFANEIDKLNTKLKKIQRGGRDFIDIITFKKPEVILVETEKKLQQTNKDINNITQILVLLSQKVKDMMDECIEVVKISFYDMLRTYLADGMVSFRKKKDFWDEAKSVNTVVVDQDDNLNKEELII